MCGSFYVQFTMEKHDLASPSWVSKKRAFNITTPFFKIENPNLSRTRTHGLVFGQLLNE